MVEKNVLIKKRGDKSINNKKNDCKNTFRTKKVEVFLIHFSKFLS